MQVKQKKQKGIVLVMALLMIFILTGLMTILISLPITDQRVVSNTQDQILATQAAQTAYNQGVMAASSWQHATNLPTSACASGKIVNTTFNLDNYPMQPISWWAANGCNANSLPASSSGALYIVKYLGCDTNNNVDLFQVIARGTGKTPTSVAFFDATVRIGTNSFAATSSTPGATLVSLRINGSLYRQAWVNISGTLPGSQPPGWTGTCVQGVSSWVSCIRNCQGQVQAIGYSGADTPVSCAWKRGPWSATSSSITLLQSPGVPRTITCSQ
jgi:Tfp pilus assembly protein PilX